MIYFKYLLYLYLALGLLGTIYTIRVLWVEDKKMDTETCRQSTSKFAYNFRKGGVQDGTFWITDTAWIMLTLTLPVINLLFVVACIRNKLSPPTKESKTK